MSETEAIDFDSDDSLRDPWYVPSDEPSGARNGSLEQNADSNQSNVVSDNELVGVNKILFNGTFFSIIEKMRRMPAKQGIIAICQVCSKRIKGELSVSSNFLKHLKRHPSKFSEFQSKKQEYRKSSERKTNFNRDLLNFICHTCSPLSILEEQSFLKLFPGKNVPSRRSITRLLVESHSEEVGVLSYKLSNIEHVCTTADVWSGGRKSFLGYTCHWIDAATFERKSVALACRRFEGSHTFDRIADNICEINEQYNLPVEEIVYTITDNGSNFVKVFKEFGVSPSNASFNVENDDESDSDDLSDDAVPRFQDVSPKLSKHFRCSSHTLNLLATADFNSILCSLSNEIKQIHKACFNRCSQIWTKSHRPKSAEIIHSVLSAHLVTPCVTRWNSLYDAAKKILQHKASLSKLCYLLGIATFESFEIEYLEEYVKLMKPIAEAIDFLQSEQNMYFGYFLPALVTIKVKLRRLEAETLKYLNVACKELQESLEKRFKKYFFLEPEAWDAVIASVSIPNVKLRFLRTLLETAVTTEDEVKYRFNQCVREFKLDGRPEESRYQKAQIPQLSYLDYGDDANDEIIPNSPFGPGPMLQETVAYLADADQNVEMLNKHTVLKKIFIKYNTPLPSSAPVERLFSFAGIVNRSRRQKLSDTNFEMLVLRKANNA